MATVSKTFADKNLIIEYEVGNALEFTDSEGRTVTFNEFGLYDFKVIETLGLSTVRKAFHWLSTNAPLLWPLMADTNWFKYAIERSITNLSDGHLSGISGYEFMCDAAYHSSNVHLDYGLWTDVLRKNNDFLSGRRGSTGGVFLLADRTGETQSGPRKVQVLMDYTILPLDTPSRSVGGSETLWNRKYNYSYKMDPDEFNFFRSNRKSETLFFGMEVEISTQLSLEEIQYIVTEVEPKQEPFFIGKDDSSVNGQYNNRVELVTVPCTPRYLRTNFKTFFEKVERLAVAKGGRTKDYFDTSCNLNNGIHIHVSRNAFENNLHRRKFNMVFHMTDRHTVKLFNEVSGRADYQNNTYCHPSREFAGRTVAYNLKNNSDRLGDHHLVASTASSQTTEVRLFQGIWDVEHVLMCIDFTESVFDFTAEMPFSVINWRFADTLKNFVLKSCKYRTFKKGLK